ncbi:hypothetical protein [Streptomyces lichenis]|uniref:Uncharacterized protein n=1 Tax=Streptomyces lichenis TaxID=2306967 RepID=A0ABT0I8B4_9ACTN|nr:hypothetical protein [Streptomyces lichenis]MCK8677544.1 hypothetical protein [Streptomyces lichenis]
MSRYLRVKATGEVMVHKTYLLSSARQLDELARYDARLVSEAVEGVRAAQLHLEQVTLRADASQRALTAVRKRLHDLTPAAGGEQDELFRTPPKGDEAEAARTTFAVAIRDFVRSQKRTTRSDIIRHVQELHPGSKTTSISSEVARLARRGRLVRLQRGVYVIGDDRPEKD